MHVTGHAPIKASMRKDLDIIFGGEISGHFYWAEDYFKIYDGLYSSYLVKNLEDLGQYPFSSFPEYIGKAKKEICQKRLVLDHFKIYGKYKEFVFNQADYQKSLAKIKHSLMD